MPNTLEKTRKKILRKRGGVLDGLHQNSRDSQRLHTAQGRDERLEAIARSRRRRDKPIIARVTYFQEAVRQNDNKPLTLEAIQAKISEFVHQFDQEYETMKKARRAGRAPGPKEDMLKLRIATLQKEYQNGYYLPDLTNENNLQVLDRWDKSWTYLANLAWVKITTTGIVKPTLFPPQSN
ncbi:translation machinery-associated protein 16 [Lasiosphaeria miniovina]|uniref:Translation machinery-associated protein 16 n=1 Tax=Lasiosphaeria miniovina TaxID=1954250 RepID=A0AA40DV88_9PEZI|nr:translation machinery-associated protein 16 [Lasiosphaeria miniovina]KAK0713013.1 translation machinery-associated protein 16 [Lasiosphaeria miniovina]